MSGADVSMQMLLSFAQLARLYAANWIPQPTFWFPASRRRSRQTWVVSLFYCQMGPSSNRQALVVSLFNFQMGPSSKGVRSRLSRSKSSSGSAPSDRDKKEGGIGRTLCERHGLSGAEVSMQMLLLRATLHPEPLAGESNSLCPTVSKSSRNALEE